MQDYLRYAVTASLVITTVTTKFVVTAVLLSSGCSKYETDDKSYDQLGCNITTNLAVTLRPTWP